MNILIRIKKMCGRLGRKYGGRPFQVVRKFIYDSHRNLSRFIPETRAIIGIYRKSFGDRNSEDARFYAPYIGVLPKAEKKKKSKKEEAVEETAQAEAAEEDVESTDAAAVAESVEGIPHGAENLLWKCKLLSGFQWKKSNPGGYGERKLSAEDPGCLPII